MQPSLYVSGPCGTWVIAAEVVVLGTDVEYLLLMNGNAFNGGTGDAILVEAGWRGGAGGGVGAGVLKPI